MSANEQKRWFHSPEVEQAISVVLKNGHLVYKCNPKFKNTISYLAIIWRNSDDNNRDSSNWWDHLITNLQDLFSLAIWDKDIYIEIKKMKYKTLEYLIMYEDFQETHHDDLLSVKKQLIERFLEEGGIRALDVKSINPFTKKANEAYKVLYGHVRVGKDDEEFSVLLRPYDEIGTKLPDNWIKEILPDNWTTQ